jgi:hypothetical protein
MQYYELMRSVYGCNPYGGGGWSNMVMFKHDTIVENIELEYPDLVENCSDWWYDELVKARREEREQERIRRREELDREDWYDWWLSKCGTQDRVEEYLKASAAEGEPPPPIFVDGRRIFSRWDGKFLQQIL